MKLFKELNGIAWVQLICRTIAGHLRVFLFYNPINSLQDFQFSIEEQGFIGTKKHHFYSTEWCFSKISVRDHGKLTVVVLDNRKWSTNE